MASPSFEQELQWLLQPCSLCDGTELRLSSEIYLGRFRAVVCAECGRTEWWCTSKREIADYVTVTLPAKDPYR